MENELLKQLAELNDKYQEIKAENEELKQLLSDAIELNRSQRVHDQTMFELIKKFKMILPTNP